MRKTTFLGVLVVLLLFGTVFASAGTNNERIWDFDDQIFSSVWTSFYIEKDTEVNGLTLGNGLEKNQSKRKMRNLWHNMSVYTPEGGSKTKGFLKFYVSGNTDIHITGASKDNNNARKLTIYSEADGSSSYIDMKDYDDYKYEYRGKAGYIYLYTEGSGVRIFGVAAKNYDPAEYAPMAENEKREWDFKDYYRSDFIKSNTVMDGLTVAATENKNVEMGMNYNKKTVYGKLYDGFLNLKGTGNADSRYISFSVPENSDIYITARSSDGASERYLIARNKYYGITDTDMEKEVIDKIVNGYGDENDYNTFLRVNGEINTYKISYYGKGDEFYLYSYDSGIKLYNITIVPRINKTTANKVWDISGNGSFAVGSYNDTKIDSLRLCNVNVEQCNIGGYNKRLSIRSGIQNDAKGIKFNVSDSSQTRGQRVKRTITIKASGESDGAQLILVNSENYLIGMAKVSKDIGEYKFEYTGSYDELCIYGYYNENVSSMRLYIYSLDNGVISANSGPEDTEKTISVVKGQKYRYFLTCNNIKDISALKYKINYNDSAISIKKLGENPTVYYDNGLYYDSCIKEVLNENGVLTFKMNNANKNWSGILCPIEFEAKSTGNTTIRIIAEVM